MKAKLAQVCILLCIALNAAGQTEQPRPMPNTYVHDFAGVITADKKEEIQAKAVRLKNEFKTEIAVVTIDSLPRGEDSFDYSMRMARSWGIGSKDNEIRGLLILVAVKDHKTSFRTSRHIEGELPDIMTAEISAAMAPYFKKGDFGGGLSLGMDRLIARFQVAAEPPPQDKPASSGSGSSTPIFLLIAIGGAAGLIIWWMVARRLKEREEASERLRARAQDNRERFLKHDSYLPIPMQGSERTATLPGKKKTGPSRRSTPTRPAEESSSRRSSSDNSGFGSSFGQSSSISDSSSSGSSSSDSSYSSGSDFGGGGSDSSW
jgi:uncharacterized protein